MSGDDDLLVTFSTIVLVCSLVLRRRRAQQKRKRRVWVHPCWRYRDLEGQACTLMPRLRAKDEVFFRDFLRMTPSTFDTLVQLVGPTVEKMDTRFRKAISAHDRLAITVRFLANGDTFRSLSFNFLIGRSTASSIVKETCAAMWRVLQPLYARFPQSPEEWKNIAADMETRWNFPNCIGCIDGKHINIECPGKTGARNLNYKKTFSTVLLAVCDAHYSFTYVDIGHYGGESDGGVFLRTALGGILEQQQYGIPPPAIVGSAGPIPYLMVGDEAFPLKPYLMRPYPGRDLQKCRAFGADRQEYLKKATFNYRLSRARRLIENSFGILASRWRILRRSFRASEETTENIIKSCVSLHNFLLKENALSRATYNPPGYADHEDWEGNVIAGTWRAENNGQPALQGLEIQGFHSARAAMDVRERLATYFMEEGMVPWQEHIVTRAG